MKIVIGENTYTKIRTLSFDPETDLTGSQVPVNEFNADLITSDEISGGGYASLYDDRDNLWARYWIVDGYHIDNRTVRIRAQSELKILDRFTLSESYIAGTTFQYLIEAIFMGLPGIYDYEVDTSLRSKTISGYFPEQTARERIQWACFVAGAYIKTYFDEGIRFIPISSTTTIIPLEKTFWKPSYGNKDYVTAVKVKAYTYTAGTPTATDKWIQDGMGGDYYIQTEQEFTLSNQNAPLTAPTNEIIVEGVTIIGQGNVSEIMTRMAGFYFTQKEIELDVINNCDYVPGQKVMVFMDPETVASGYIKSCSFTFGLQARSKIILTNVTDETSETAKLVIKYMYNNMQIDKKSYRFPIGYEYEISNPYLAQMMNKHYCIFRPLQVSATGTIQEGTNTDVEECAVALDLYKGILHVVSVDSVTVETSGTGENELRVAVIT